MSNEGNAVSTLMWGLRRYAWVVLAAMVVLGISVPQALQRNQVAQYDARAQVGPVTKLEIGNLDALPRSGESVFTNGAVAAAVRQELGLSETDPVIPERVELIAPQDNVVFTVVGHAANPQDAANAANAAAGRLTQELNKYRDPVGTFAVQSSAVPPAKPLPSVGWTPLVLAGLLAGLLVGVGIVGLVLTVRRPVLGAAGAEQVTGAKVLGSLQLDLVESRFTGLPHLVHTVARGATSLVYLAGPRSGREDRDLLGDELRRLLAANGRGVRDGAGPRVVEDPSQLELAVRPPDSMTLLVVPTGIRESTLRREAETYLDPGSSGLVLVRRTGRFPATLLARRRARRPQLRSVGAEDDPKKTARRVR